MVPAIEAVIAKPTARVLLLFPTKALAQDQLGKLSALAEAACPMLLAATLDGDTPKADRLQLRQRCHVFLSNPDLLAYGCSLHHIRLQPPSHTAAASLTYGCRCHVFLSNPDLLAATILPRHDEWSEVLSNLSLVAVDEAHAYHGVFGSHVSLVLRRLRRLCALYGASPTFVGCSATIASPRAHFALLTGLPAEAIAAVADDGAPRGERVCAVWNPPERPPSEADADPFCFREDVEEEGRQPGGARRRVSTLAEAARLLALLVRHGLKTLAFVKARSVAELLVERTRALLPTEQAERLQCYRAGYSKEARRAIEAELFAGRLLGVVATNALELGVDVGCLDAVLADPRYLVITPVTWLPPLSPGLSPLSPGLSPLLPGDHLLLPGCHPVLPGYHP